jgi:putative endonuclease
VPREPPRPVPPPARDPPGTPIPGTGGAAAATTGSRGEHLAAAHLRRLGFEILARNLRTAGGEIDLIACDGKVIAFVEVKAKRLARPRRAGEGALVPLERLLPAQRARLRRLALAWLCEQRSRPRAPAVRFDAIGILLAPDGRLLALEHLEDAW